MCDNIFFHIGNFESSFFFLFFNIELIYEKWRQLAVLNLSTPQNRTEMDEVEIEAEEEESPREEGEEVCLHKQQK